MKKHFILSLFSMWLLCLPARAAQLSSEAIINLPVAAAWELFTTEGGLKSLGYTQAKSELQLGGAWQASGGNVAITGLQTQIISFDPQHMLSFRIGGANDRWGVLYFNAMGQEMTQLRWLEFFPAAQQAQAALQQQQVQALFQQLTRRFAPECHVCKEEREAAQARTP